jgi:hypothetical protein
MSRDDPYKTPTSELNVAPLEENVVPLKEPTGPRYLMPALMGFILTLLAEVILIGGEYIAAIRVFVDVTSMDILYITPVFLFGGYLGFTRRARMGILLRVKTIAYYTVFSTAAFMLMTYEPGYFSGIEIDWAMLIISVAVVSLTRAIFSYMALWAGEAFGTILPKDMQQVRKLIVYLKYR